MKKPVILIAFILFFVTAAAAENPLSALLLRSGYDAADQRAITALFDRAAAEKLPEAFLLPRLEEGVAKRIPARPLGLVLEREIESFLTARRVLQSVDPALIMEENIAIWQRAALCLNKGMSGSDLGTIAGAAVKRRPDFRAATELYLTLARWGLETDAARHLAVGVLGSRLAGGDFAGIASIFAKGRARYLTTKAITDRILYALPRITTVAELTNNVLY